MAEDSGAFKTNPRNSARIGHFVNGPVCGKDASLHEKKSSGGLRPRGRADFVTNSVRRCDILIRPDSPPREAGRPLVVTAFPKSARQAEPAPMLPGFRFLFAAIVLSTSVLVFGLGAAALLRAAHEEFASNPSWRAAPEPVFAQANDPPPTLAMVRLEPVAAENAPDVANATAAVEQVAEATTPAEPEMPAAVEPEDSAAVKMPEPEPVETAEAEAPAEETAPAPAEAPAPLETTVTAEEAKPVMPRKRRPRRLKPRRPSPSKPLLSPHRKPALRQPGSQRSAAPPSRLRNRRRQNPPTRSPTRPRQEAGQARSCAKRASASATARSRRTLRCSAIRSSGRTGRDRRPVGQAPFGP